MLPSRTQCILLFAARLASAKSLWSSSPASNASDIIRHAYPIGNGRLAALGFGEAGSEKLTLNRDSLWSGGPFANTSYNGGNPSEERYSHLEGIRNWYVNVLLYLSGVERSSGNLQFPLEA